MAVTVLKYIVGIAALFGVGYGLYQQATPLFQNPCEQPIAYAVTAIDSRFEISTSSLERALADAVSVWNTAADRTLFIPSTEKAIEIELVYSEVQRATKLEKSISQEQAAYDAKKQELNELKREFARARQTYEDLHAAFQVAADTYDQKITYWNEKGGAPKEEYDQLNEEREDLQRLQEELNQQADTVNVISASLQSEVEALNALGAKINAKVDVFNESAGDEFDQGEYSEGNGKKRIVVYEYSNETDLRRVLAHEFGHALWMDHVANPESIMYSYNVGDDLTPSPEDIAELQRVCDL